MTNPTLAAASDYAVWAAVVLLALAMLAFSVHLAVVGSLRQPGEVRVSSRVPATVGAPAANAAPSGASSAGASTTLPATPSASGRRWGVIGLQLTWLATFATIGAWATRGLSVARPPLGNMYEFSLGIASFALLVYSVWAIRKDRLWLGPFVTLPVLLVLGAARLGFYTEASQLMPALKNIWLVIHVTAATLAIALFTIGVALAIAYLIRDRAELRGQVKGWVAALPGAASLERMTYGVHIVAFPLWTFAVIAGAIWAEQAWGRYWGWDPKETWSFIVWVVYAAYLHARATSSWSARRATWLAVLGAVCIILNYVLVNLLMTGLHSYSGVAS